MNHWTNPNECGKSMDNYQLFDVKNIVFRGFDPSGRCHHPTKLQCMKSPSRSQIKHDDKTLSLCT
jgi:hypothetical protein